MAAKALSGIKLDNECLERYNEIKLRDAHKFMMMGFNDNFTTVEVKELAEPEEKEKNFAQFKEYLIQQKSCRFVIYDYSNQENSVRGLIFIKWLPENCPIKEKMLCGSSLESVRKSFEGIKGTVDAHEPEDLDEANIMSKIKKS